MAFNARKSTIDCVVRNFTPYGAKVEFSNTAILPDEVDLIIERKSAAFVAHMAWRNKDEAGFLFRSPLQLHATTTLDWTLRLRATERANKALAAKVDQLRSEY